jgi:hypothetical protein
VAEVAHGGSDGACIALDDDNAETTGMGFDGVRETDNTGTDNDEVRSRCGLLVGHDADSNVIAVPFLDVA